MATRTRYKTKQREQLLRCIKALEAGEAGHVTVERIYAALQKSGCSIGQTTVYRNLDKLVQEGLVLRYELPGGTGACYQYLGRVGGCRHHYHMICTSCGQVSHLDCGFMADFSAHMYTSHRFALDEARTVLYGCCERCNDKMQD